MNGLIHQELLSLMLLAQLFAESEKLLDRRVIILLHDVLRDKVMNILDQKLATVRQVSEALHQLLGTRNLLQVHYH